MALTARNETGFGGYRPFVDLDPKVADGLLQIHIRAAVKVARAVLPGMVARNSGGIINVASLLAFPGAVPTAPFLPSRAVYAAAKAFLLTFTQILASELAATNVRAQVCLLGLVDTEFHAARARSSRFLRTRRQGKKYAA